MLFIFTLINLITTEESGSDGSSILGNKIECKTDLLNAYNLKGYKNPKVMQLEMCNGVNLSCCTKEDQLQIYGAYVQAKEQALIKSHYATVKTTYFNLLNLLQQTHDMAKKIVVKQKLKKIGNCKLMSERLLAYDVPSYINQIKQLFTKSEEFFKATYQGFYCSLCKADYHAFFDLESKKITFAQKFCRDIVEHNLPTLLYEIRDLIKLANLTSQLLASCDFIGTFNVNGLPPADVILTYNAEEVKIVEECYTYRNDKNWFTYCTEVCNRFSPVTFSSFFEGQVQQVANLVNWGKQRNLQLLDQAKKNPLGQVRLLEEKENLDDDLKIRTDVNQRRLEATENVQQKPIFTPSSNSQISLVEFTVQFKSSGIKMYDLGNSTVIDVDKFEQIKTAINLAKTSSTTDNTSRAALQTGEPKSNGFFSGLKLVLPSLMVFLLIN